MNLRENVFALLVTEAVDVIEYKLEDVSIIFFFLVKILKKYLLGI